MIGLNKLASFCLSQEITMSTICHKRLQCQPFITRDFDAYHLSQEITMPTIYHNRLWCLLTITRYFRAYQSSQEILSQVISAPTIYTPQQITLLTTCLGKKVPTLYHTIHDTADIFCFHQGTCMEGLGCLDNFPDTGRCCWCPIVWLSYILHSHRQSVTEKQTNQNVIQVFADLQDHFMGLILHTGGSKCITFHTLKKQAENVFFFKA